MKPGTLRGVAPGWDGARRCCFENCASFLPNATNFETAWAASFLGTSLGWTEGIRGTECFKGLTTNRMGSQVAAASLKGLAALGLSRLDLGLDSG